MSDTKEIEVWRVTCAVRGEPNGRWWPSAHMFEAAEVAENAATEMKNRMFGTPFVPMFSCVEITGPHMQRMPSEQSTLRDAVREARASIERGWWHPKADHLKALAEAGEAQLAASRNRSDGD